MAKTQSTKKDLKPFEIYVPPVDKKPSDFIQMGPKLSYGNWVMQNKNEMKADYKYKNKQATSAEATEAINKHLNKYISSSTLNQVNNGGKIKVSEHEALVKAFEDYSKSDNTHKKVLRSYRDGARGKEDGPVTYEDIHKATGIETGRVKELFEGSIQKGEIRVRVKPTAAEGKLLATVFDMGEPSRSQFLDGCESKGAGKGK